MQLNILIFLQTAHNDTALGSESQSRCVILQGQDMIILTKNKMERFTMQKLGCNILEMLRLFNDN